MWLEGSVWAIGQLDETDRALTRLNFSSSALSDLEARLTVQ